MAEPKDLVQAAINHSPLDFQNSFEEIMASKVADAVAELKLDVAQNVFSPAQEVDDNSDWAGDAPQEVDTDVTEEGRDWFKSIKKRSHSDMLAKGLNTVFGPKKNAPVKPPVTDKEPKAS